MGLAAMQGESCQPLSCLWYLFATYTSDGELVLVCTSTMNGLSVAFNGFVKVLWAKERRFISNPAEFTYQLYKLILKIKERKNTLAVEFMYSDTVLYAQLSLVFICNFYVCSE